MSKGKGRRSGGLAGLELVKDPARVAQLGERKAGEHMRFRAQLKSSAMTDEELDRLFHRAFEQVRAQIDCTSCGACCRSLQFTVEEVDVERLARHQGTSVDEFRVRYLRPCEHGGETLGKPCPFLEGNRCSCYEARPEVCRQYPHLDKECMRSRLFSVVGNASVCPIVYNVVEALRFQIARRGRG